ncbi:hypothetical protein HYU15_00265 [Candidatus Woesearchaeota archaeon]|nr:hypothetical protein [Candidatus Woesearchaeota archaeon]
MFLARKMRAFPSLREKRRYLVFEVVSGQKHIFAEVKEALLSAVSEFFGSREVARFKPRVLADKWDFERQRGVLVAERKGMEKVKAAVCLASRIGKSRAIIRSLGMSGILRKAIAKHY